MGQFKTPPTSSHADEDPHFGSDDQRGTSSSLSASSVLQPDDDEDFLHQPSSSTPILISAQQPTTHTHEALQPFIDYVFAAYFLHETGSHYQSQIKLGTRRSATATELETTLREATRKISEHPGSGLSTTASNAFTDLVTKTVAQAWTILSDRAKPTYIHSSLLSGIRKDLDTIFTRSRCLREGDATNDALQAKLFKLFAKQCIKQMQAYKALKLSAEQTPELSRRLQEVETLIDQANVLSRSCEDVLSGKSSVNVNILVEPYKRLLLAIEHLKSSLRLRSSSNLANELGRLLTLDADLLRPRLNQLRGYISGSSTEQPAQSHRDYQQPPIDITTNERDAYARLRAKDDFVKALPTELTATGRAPSSFRIPYFSDPEITRSFDQTQKRATTLSAGLTGSTQLASGYYVFAPASEGNSHDCIPQIPGVPTHAIDDVINRELPQPLSQQEAGVYLASIDIARIMLTQTNNPVWVAKAMQFMHAAAISIERAYYHLNGLPTAATVSDELDQWLGGEEHAKNVQAFVDAITAKIGSTYALEGLSPTCRLAIQTARKNKRDVIAALFTALLAENLGISSVKLEQQHWLAYYQVQLETVLQEQVAPSAEAEANERRAMLERPESHVDSRDRVNTSMGGPSRPTSILIPAMQSEKRDSESESDNGDDGSDASNRGLHNATPAYLPYQGYQSTLEGMGEHLSSTSRRPRTMTAYIKELADTIDEAAHSTRVSTNLLAPFISDSSTGSASTSRQQQELRLNDTRYWTVQQRCQILDRVARTLNQPIPTPTALSSTLLGEPTSTSISAPPAPTTQSTNWFLIAFARLVDVGRRMFSNTDHLEQRGQAEDEGHSYHGSSLHPDSPPSSSMSPPPATTASTSIGGDQSPAAPFSLGSLLPLTGDARNRDGHGDGDSRVSSSVSSSSDDENLLPQGSPHSQFGAGGLAFMAQPSIPYDCDP